MKRLICADKITRLLHRSCLSIVVQNCLQSFFALTRYAEELNSRAPRFFHNSKVIFDRSLQIDGARYFTRPSDENMIPTMHFSFGSQKTSTQAQAGYPIIEFIRWSPTPIGKEVHVDARMLSDNVKIF